MEADLVTEAPKVDIDDQTAMGFYCNDVVVAHSGSDFVLDFIFQPPHGSRPRVRARVIFTPKSAKGVLVELDGAIASFEREHGVIG